MLNTEVGKEKTLVQVPYAHNQMLYHVPGVTIMKIELASPKTSYTSFGSNDSRWVRQGNPHQLIASKINI